MSKPKIKRVFGWWELRSSKYLSQDPNVTFSVSIVPVYTGDDPLTIKKNRNTHAGAAVYVRSGLKKNDAETELIIEAMRHAVYDVKINDGSLGEAKKIFRDSINEYIRLKRMIGGQK